MSTNPKPTPPVTEQQIKDCLDAAAAMERCLQRCALVVALSIEQKASKQARELRDWAGTREL